MTALRERLSYITTGPNMADRVVRELLSYLTDHGLAIVPVEATDDMLTAGHAWQWDRNLWDAMVKAAPPAAELLAGTKEKTSCDQNGEPQ